MTVKDENIIPVTIESELKQSYLDYAMSVIVGRALPDVRDGLKPVHRRALFAMHELNNDWNKPYKKSARVVGDVVGKYHPHSDTAAYDTIVRMAQTFSLRYPLVDGQGNFGSVDGDSPAAMRYTEVRMAKITHSLLADIEKETVDYSPNYDGTEMIPNVLPTRVPNLLVNGSSGIAVGMATNIPPHNLNEIIDGTLALMDNSEITIPELMEYIPGPDFPTAAIINGQAGIRQAYKTGRGRIRIRARADIETLKNDRQAIIITEFPYQVNKARLIEKVGELVREKAIEGIAALRDESDKDGIRVVIEVKRNENPEVLLNKLYSQTQLETVFGINMVALDSGQPRAMNLKEILEAFVKHRREVVTRRTIFELRKARERAHILEGLGVALANIDDVIKLIKAAKSSAEAKVALLEKIWNPGAVAKLLESTDQNAARPDDLEPEFGFQGDGYKLSPSQAQAILDMRLHRLTGLEQDKIFNEYREILDKIKELLSILSDSGKLLQLIRDELSDIREQFGDKRRTEIIEAQEDLTIEDMIDDEEVVVTISSEGYAKVQTLDVYKSQRRGGRGKSATSMKDEDFIDQLVVAKMHDTLLCFSDRGKLYWLKVYMLPQGSRSAKGKPIVNLLPLETDESITTLLPVREYREDQYVFFATSKGTVKKVALNQFSRPRSNGIIAVDLRDDDYLVGVGLTDGEKDVMLFTDAGKVIRFEETDVRAMGRTARGVRGVRMQDGQKVISLIIADDDAAILTATEKGYGKRTMLDQYPRRGRGGQGVISIQCSDRNGQVVGAIQVTEQDEMMLITDQGTLVRLRASDISVIGRNTQGVRLINLASGERLVSLQRVAEDDVSEDEEIESSPEPVNEASTDESTET